MEATDRPGTNGVRQEAVGGGVPTFTSQSVPEAFTLGPWTAEPCPCGWSPCHVITSPVEKICESVVGANAHLIAAAPDMYEALKVACGLVMKAAQTGSWNSDEYALIRAALSKAAAPSPPPWRKPHDR